MAIEMANLAGLSQAGAPVMTRGSSRRLEIFCEDAYLWTEDDYLGPLHVDTPHLRRR